MINKKYSFEQNINMVVAVFIFFLLIVLLVLDFRIVVSANYDFENNIGLIKIKLFGIKIFQGKFSLVGDYINFVGNNKNVLQIKLVDIDAKTIKIVREIGKSFAKRINVLSLNLFSNVCGQSPYHVSLLNGFIKMMFGVAHSNIRAQNDYITLRSNVYSNFLNDDLMLGFECCVVINLYDLIWSVIRSLYIRSFGYDGQKEFGK